jgi:CubicO group peptidase (beta-lactamase class C family)/transglutaminase-like putative cysteine protease
MLPSSTSSRMATGLALTLLAACVAAAPAADPCTPERVQRAWSAIDTGNFTEAERLLRDAITDPDAPVVDECAVTLEMIRRIRLDHRLSAEQMLERLRTSIPDVTAADVRRWTRAGKLQHRVIDGQPRYFNRAGGNLFRASPEAKARRKPRVAPAGDTFDWPTHLARLLAESDDAGSRYIHPVRHRVRYELTVKENHPRLRRGARVRCWLPFPQELPRQRDVRLVSTDPPTATVAPNGHPHRTVYFEQTVEDASAAPTFVAEFEFTSYADVPQLDPARVKPYDTDSSLFREFTAERPPHIVFTPEVDTLVKEIAGDEANPLIKARRIFSWVAKNIPWFAEMEYSTIRSLSSKGLATRKGDCGVQGLVFVTLCRAAGIPARWQSGWQTTPGDWNMHDWSEIYVEPWGWLPADASYGVQKHPDPRVQTFYCGHIDAYRLIVNLDYARALHPPKTSFRSEPNDFQRGEIEIDGHNLYFDEWRYRFKLRTLPPRGEFASLEEACDAIVSDLLAAGKIPGAVLAVGRRTADGFETWQKAYGFARLQPDRAPMRPDAVFDMASLTKPIATGTSLMCLVENGRVGLDDPVSRYLPEFASGDKSKVTVRHLMTHTSGMPPYVGAGRQKVIKEKAGFPCPAETRAYVRKLDLRHPPGERVTYSCLNAMLAAEIVERVSGESLDTFAARRLFDPLRMVDTGFNPPQRNIDRCIPTTRTDYGRGPGGFLQGQVHDPLAAMQAGVSGNAGLFSTAADLARFAQMMIRGGELDGVRVLRPETITQMTAIEGAGNEHNRGLMWGLYVPEPDASGAALPFAYGHTGYTGTAIRIYPQQGVYVIALANRVHPDDSGKIGAFRRQVWRTVGAVLLDAPHDW